MIHRTMIAFGVFLIFASSTLAQTPEEDPSSLETPEEGRSTPALSPDQGPLSSFLPMPRGWSMPSSEGRFWLSGDYLFAYTRGARLPALVTTSDAGTARGIAGVLGSAGSSTLFGDSGVNSGLGSGLRLGTGCWFHAESAVGIEAGLMILESKVAHFTDSSGNFPILARPFLNANNSVPGSVLVAFPGSSTGSVDARATSGNFYEGHVDLTEKALDGGWLHVTSMLGYRYYRYDEGIRVRQIINPTSATFIPGTQIVTNDNFNTRNEFHGIDMGFRSQCIWNTLSLELLTKVAVGRVFRTINIGGDQLITAPGTAPIAQTGGLLALGPNSGSTASHDWKVMPEAGAALNWQIRSNLNVRVGYSFVLLNGVVRAADQIDTTVNPNLFPGGKGGGPLRPAANSIRSDLWIQSINLGLQLTY